MALQEQKLSHRRRARPPATVSSRTRSSFYARGANTNPHQAQRTGESN